MSPASTDVEDCSDRVCDLEELVAGPTYDSLHAEDGQEGDQERSHAAKDGVHVREEQVVYVGCRAVVIGLHDCPANRVKRGLCENDTSAPAVEEVEVLVRDASQHGENAVTAGEEDRERS